MQPNRITHHRHFVWIGISTLLWRKVMKWKMMNGCNTYLRFALDIILNSITPLSWIGRHLKYAFQRRKLRSTMIDSFIVLVLLNLDPWHAYFRCLNLMKMVLLGISSVSPGLLCYFQWPENDLIWTSKSSFEKHILITILFISKDMDSSYLGNQFSLQCFECCDDT